MSLEHFRQQITTFGARRSAALRLCAHARCACLVVAPLGFVFFHLVRMGASAESGLSSPICRASVGELGGGMANAIVGTLELLGLACSHRRSRRRARRHLSCGVWRAPG